MALECMARKNIDKKVSIGIQLTNNCHQEGIRRRIGRGIPSSVSIAEVRSIDRTLSVNGCHTIWMVPIMNVDLNLKNQILPRLLNLKKELDDLKRLLEELKKSKKIPFD